MSDDARTRRDQAIAAGYKEAETIQARGERLREALAANPGRWPEVEKRGIRAEEHGDGDPHDELDNHERKLKERDGR